MSKKSQPIRQKEVLPVPAVTARVVRDLREHLGETQGQFAERFGVNQSTVSRWEEGADLGATAWQMISQLQRDLKDIEDVHWPTADVQAVEVIGEVQAGHWVEAVQWEPSKRFRILVPRDERFPNAKRQAFRVRGPSMNKLYPDGSIVIAVPTIGNEIQPKSGSRVVVQRRDKHGLFEATVKEYIVDARGNQWLIPQSDDPAHAAPLEIPKPASNDEGDDVVVTGLVIGSYKQE